MMVWNMTKRSMRINQGEGVQSYLLRLALTYVNIHQSLLKLRGRVTFRVKLGKNMDCSKNTLITFRSLILNKASTKNLLRLRGTDQVTMPFSLEAV